MVGPLVALVIAVLVICLIILLLLIVRRRDTGITQLQSDLAVLQKTCERAEQTVREEMSRNREEAGNAGRQLREEVNTSIRTFAESVATTMSQISQLQKGQLETFSTQLETLTRTNEQKLEAMRDTVEQKLTRMQIDAQQAMAQTREEIGKSITTFCDSVLCRMTEIATLQKNQLDSFATILGNLVQTNEQKLEQLRQTVEAKLTQMQTDAQQASQQNRDEVAKSLTSLAESLSNRIMEIAKLQREQLESFGTTLNTLVQTNEQKLEQMRSTVEQKLGALQQDNAAKLDQMRATVDEKLHATLEQRLGESFKLVSERLEQVHVGLGEMKNLAAGVGDLKKVLTNIKTRGCWGEVQLGRLLEEMLTPDQYEANVAVCPNSLDRVEFAIKLPGRDDAGKPVWLPIDAKFPQEDYQRLVDASEQGNAEAAEAASMALEQRIRQEARKIREKYIQPPNTTDFGIMFLATEGLFAEAVRRPGLYESIMHNCRVVLTGPTTLSAVLSSLQMGFRTLAIEKRSSEVWAVLGAVKTEFGKFGESLEKVQKKLQEASNSIDNAAKRSRAVERKLRNVEALPADQEVPRIGSMEVVDVLDGQARLADSDGQDQA